MVTMMVVQMRKRVLRRRRFDEGEDDLLEGDEIAEPDSIGEDSPLEKNLLLPPKRRSQRRRYCC